MECHYLGVRLAQAGRKFGCCRLIEGKNQLFVRLWFRIDGRVKSPRTRTFALDRRSRAFTVHRRDLITQNHCARESCAAHGHRRLGSTNAELRCRSDQYSGFSGSSGAASKPQPGWVRIHTACPHRYPKFHQSRDQSSSHVCAVRPLPRTRWPASPDGLFLQPRGVGPLHELRQRDHTGPLLLPCFRLS